MEPNHSQITTNSGKTPANDGNISVSIIYRQHCWQKKPTGFWKTTRSCKNTLKSSRQFTPLYFHLIQQTNNPSTRRILYRVSAATCFGHINSHNRAVQKNKSVNIQPQNEVYLFQHFALPCQHFYFLSYNPMMVMNIAKICICCYSL
jgi:hypothetical protein